MGVSKNELFSPSQNQIATLAKVLGHPARVAILEHLLAAKSCVNTYLVKETGLAQATVSQHLKELKNVGLIQGTIEGSSVSYCINRDAWEAVAQHFHLFFNQIETNSSNSCCS